MFKDLDALSIAQFQEQQLNNPLWPESDTLSTLAGPWRWIDANHRYNGLLWREEDKARRTDVGAAAIASSKRLIDQHAHLSPPGRLASLVARLQITGAALHDDLTVLVVGA